jgi:dihydroorotate dehydrogenase electron transfer subunit
MLKDFSMLDDNGKPAAEDGIAIVAAIDEVAPGLLHVGLLAPHIAARIRPGQFVMVQVRDADEPLLRRPLSVCRATGDHIELLVQVRGRGTRCVAAWRPGEQVRVLGPLGNGFTLSGTHGSALLVAGGIGVAPLISLAGVLCGASGRRWMLLFGGASAGDLDWLERFSLPGAEIAYATENGSLGRKGLVTDLLSSYLQATSAPGRNSASIYSCGPTGMQREVARIAAAHGLPCQVSLEARMACGVGACLGCAVGIRAADAPGACAAAAGYRRVCRDGPVFDGSEVDWDRVAL